MHMTNLEAIDEEPHRFAICAHGGGCNRRIRMVDFGAAVAGLIDVGVRRQIIGLNRQGSILIHVVGKREFKSIRLGSHFVNLEGNLARPVESLKRVRFATRRPLTSVRATDKHLPLLGNNHSNIARSESALEGKARTLVMAFDFL